MGFIEKEQAIAIDEWGWDMRLSVRMFHHLRWVCFKTLTNLVFNGNFFKPSANVVLDTTKGRVLQSMGLKGRVPKRARLLTSQVKT